MSAAPFAPGTKRAVRANASVPMRVARLVRWDNSVAKGFASDRTTVVTMIPAAPQKTRVAVTTIHDVGLPTLDVVLVTRVVARRHAEARAGTLI